MAAKHALKQSHAGYFTLNLNKGVSLEDIPKNDVTIEDNSIAINGKIEKIKNGFQFSVNGKTFTFYYDQVKSIENHYGAILWKNWHKKV